jgi:hypothetical protein
VLGTEVGLAQGSPGEVGGNLGLDEREGLVELDVVHDLARDPVGHPPPHLVLGEHDVGGPDLVEDAAVRLGDRLGPDVGDPQRDQLGHGEDAGLHVAHPHHHVVEGRDPELLEHLGAGRVGGDRLGQEGREALHDRLLHVDAEDVVAELDELEGEAAPEPSQADDQDLLTGLGLSPSVSVSQ